jgi:hypothetical protein
LEYPDGSFKLLDAQGRFIADIDPQDGNAICRAINNFDEAVGLLDAIKDKIDSIDCCNAVYDFLNRLKEEGQ